MKIWKAVPICSALCLLTACGGPEQELSSTQFKSEPEDTSAVHESLPAFNAIDMNVVMADIHVLPGENWTIAYRLSDKEVITDLEVKGDTLYLNTDIDPREKSRGHEGWYVTVTVPPDADMKTLELNTVSGDVVLEEMSCDTAYLSTVSGDVRGRELSCDSGTLASASGDIEGEDLTYDTVEFSSVSGNMDLKKVMANKIGVNTISGAITLENAETDQMVWESISGDVSMDGTFGTVTTKTVSGETEIRGSITESGEMESVSGELRLLVENPLAIKAESRGTIRFRDTQVQRSLQMGEGVPVSLVSVSGSIQIQTDS